MAGAARSEAEGFRHLFTEQGGFKEVDRVPMRPLGQVSDFVVERLPDELAKIRDGVTTAVELSQKVEEILPGNLIHKLLPGSGSKDLALLDLKMLMFGIVHSGGEPGPHLQELVKSFAVLTGQPESITYEEIILINPEHDPRLFTSGEVGAAEYDFYHLHRLVEPVLEEAIIAANVSKTALKEGDNLTAAAYIAQSSAHINLAAQHVRVVGQEMDPKLFEAFRPYLGEYAEAGLPGPSGAFTARIPLLDMAFAGEQFPGEYYDSIGHGDKLLFFPRDGRVKMEQEMERIADSKNESLVGLYQTHGRSEEVGQELELMRQALLEFRQQHYKGVVRQVPKAVNDSIAGTGGQGTPGSFLRNRMKFLREVSIN